MAQIEENWRRKIWLLIVARVFIATIILVAGVFIIEPVKKEFYFLLAFPYALTVIYALLVIKLKESQVSTFVFWQIIIDLILETGIIYHTYRPEQGFFTTFSFLYILSILSAAIFLLFKRTLVIATLSSVFYGTLLSFFYKIILNRFPIDTTEAELIYIGCYHVIIFYLTAFLSGYLSESLRRKGEELSKLQIFTDDILYNVSSGIISVNKEGRILYVNRVGEEILKNIKSIIRGEYVDLFLTEWSIDRLGKYNSDRLEYEGEMTTKDGKVITIGFTVSDLRSKNREKIGYILIFRDLTEVKFLEEKIREADRLSTVGMLAAGIAHEIRNPLAAVRGATEVLSEDNSLAGDKKRLFNLIIKESDRLDYIVEKFLAFSKSPRRDFEIADLKKVLEEVMESVKNIAVFKDKNIKVDIFYSKTSFMVNVNIHEIKEVFYNLITNAFESMSSGGELRINMEIVSLSGNDNKDEGEEIKIVFEDTGTGIPENKKKLIFDPFYTDKARGVGLGLAITKQIINNHKGKIMVSSKTGQGARFEIYLPC
jgi:two-component system sensor histidine kinase PilS (NtrC family)